MQVNPLYGRWRDERTFFSLAVFLVIEQHANTASPHRQSRQVNIGMDYYGCIGGGVNMNCLIE